MRNREHTSDACLFLLCLLLTPVTPTCRKGTADECKNAEFVPGYTLSSKGFDIFYLTMKRRSWADVNQWETSDGSCTLCENPLLEGKPLQKLPLIISDWKANISCQLEVQHSVHQSVVSLAKALTKLEVKNDWGNELDLKISRTIKVQSALAGFGSELVQNCLQNSRLDKYTYFLHHITCSYYKFQVNKKYFTRHFERKLNQLPEKYDPSSQDTKYHDFMASYGTHIGTDLDLGVRIRNLTAFPVCLLVLEGVSVSEVSSCLAIKMGIAFGLEGVTNSPDFQMCEEKKKNSDFFLQLLSGDSEEWLVFTMPSKTSKDWLESGKSRPVVLSYSLEPLHALVPKSNPRREGLRQVVSEYVRQYAQWENCTPSCPIGTQPSASVLCSCECPNNNFTNSMCCSPKQGLAKLKVTIERAYGLWGDYFSHSDAYVAVIFQNKHFCTPTKWNNDDPTWYVSLDFGVIQLNEDLNSLEVEVWDEDNGWDDDILGKCVIEVSPWTYELQTCYLRDGKLEFKYFLICGTTLGGPLCRDYRSLQQHDSNDHGHIHDSPLH